MKILMITPVPPDEEGAGAIPVLLYGQVVALRERHELTIVTSTGEEGGEAEAAARLAASGFDVHFADRRQPTSARGRWGRRFRFATEWLRGKPWRAIWFGDPGVQEIVDRLAATRAFDLVVVEDSAMSCYALPPGVPAVLTEHEVLRPRRTDWRGHLSASPRTWARRALGELDWKRRPPFQLRAWRRFDRVIVFSGRDAKTIAELAPDVAPRVRVSPFGLALPTPADPAREEADTLVFVGAFAHRPNRDAAIWLAREIMPALRRRRPGARLRLVGNSPPPSVTALSGEAVEVIASPPSVTPYLEAASVVVAPVRTGGGMRMKILQALAAGKAVVTTSRGAEGFDALDPSPPMVVADSPESIATEVATLLGEDAKRHDLAGRARAFAEQRCSTGAWALRLEDTYEETIRERSARHG